MASDHRALVKFKDLSPKFSWDNGYSEFLGDLLWRATPRSRQLLKTIMQVWRHLSVELLQVDTSKSAVQSRRETPIATLEQHMVCNCASHLSPLTKQQGNLLAPSAPHLITQVFYMPASPLLLMVDAKNPSSWIKPGKLNTVDELKAVESGLHGTMQLEVKMATPHSVATALSMKGAWLHFSMHSTTDQGGVLLLEDPFSAQVVPLCRERLRQILKVQGTSISGIFISSCYGHWVAETFRDAGVKHIVYFDGDVTDKLACSYAKHFYSALANLNSVQEAVQHTNQRNGLQASLFSDGKLWLAPLAVAQILKTSVCTTSTTSVVPHEVSRRHEIDLVTRLLHHNDVVLLVSDVPSCGLTTTLHAIAEHVSSIGRTFENRCAFVESIPSEAASGLLVVDDIDKMPGEHGNKVRDHLKNPCAKLLCGSHRDLNIEAYAEYLGGNCRVARVELKLLSDDELANIFLSNCGRAIIAGDLLSDKELAGSDPDRKLQKEEASKVLAGYMVAFAGNPGQVCRAAESRKLGLLPLAKALQNTPEPPLHAQEPVEVCKEHFTSGYAGNFELQAASYHPCAQFLTCS